MRLRSVATALAVVVTILATPACGQGTQPLSRTRTAAPVTSGDCPGEHAIVQRALDRSHLRVDVNGDGRLDTVAVASRPRAQKPCRAFVAVRVQGGTTYSNHLFRQAVPLKGLHARVVGLPHLGSRPGAQIVVDTTAAVDAVLAQMFTLADGRLRLVAVPGFKDGTFIVAGGGVVFPRGAGCTADGRMILSQAAQSRDGKQYRVTRRTYDVRGERRRLVDPVVAKVTVPTNQLVSRFPEFGGPHWKACTGTVRR